MKYICLYALKLLSTALLAAKSLQFPPKEAGGSQTLTKAAHSTAAPHYTLVAASFQFFFPGFLKGCNGIFAIGLYGALNG